VDESGVQLAIEQILADYQHLAANARKCYAERYDFSLFFDQVIQQVDMFNRDAKALA
jgi:hypothetical protein